jgi:GAF domain-containing protein
MRRRSKAGPERAKSRRKTTPQKLGGLRNPSAADHKTQPDVTQLTRERDEALEREKGTAEVLRVISSSPGELKPVFQAMLASATRICEAQFGNLFLREEDTFRAVAVHGPSTYRRKPVLSPAEIAGTPLARVAESKEALQISDLSKEQIYLDKNPHIVALVESAEARTIMGVPLIKDKELIGAIFIYRQEVRPFTDKQIDLLQNFAKQAVIAIENTRLLDELRESLQQQTATADVLKVISSSPGELQSVFQAMLENATRICGAKFSLPLLLEGDAYRYAALHGAPPAFVESCQRRQIISVNPGTAMGRAAATKKPVQFADIRAEPAYTNDPERFSILHDTGARTFLSVPMLKDNDVIGAINIYRQEVRPFTDKQIELVKNFANQAVIAIENTRLLNELRESLQQQTATADVLKVISRSTFDLQTVFDTLLQSAARLCDAKPAMIWLQHGESYKLSASYSFSPEFEDFCKQNPILPGRTRGTITGRTVMAGKAVHFPDVVTDPEFAESEYLNRSGVRTALGVPLLRQSRPIGVFVLTRPVIKPFTDKQIKLVETFADQAVIAIENVRLFDAEQARTRELTESLQQQTATADVLKVISRSTFDLRTVLHTLVESAARLCEADQAAITQPQDDVLLYAASFGFPQGFIEIAKRTRFVPGRGTITGRVLLEGNPVQIDDVLADPEYNFEGQKTAGFRTALGVPLLREGETIGVMALTRSRVRPFTDKQIELVTIFADQAVIAIGNVRLFEEVQARTRELNEALEQQTATSEVLEVISRSTFDLKSVLQTLVESTARLCDADYVTITRQKEGVLFFAEAYGFSSEFIEYVRGTSVERGRGTATGRALQEGQVIHIADVLADPDYTWAEAQRLGDYRTVLAVPMLREGIPIGVLTLTRSMVRPSRSSWSIPSPTSGNRD